MRKHIKDVSESKGVDTITLNKILDNALSKKNNKIIFERLAEI